MTSPTDPVAVLRSQMIDSSKRIIADDYDLTMWIPVDDAVAFCQQQMVAAQKDILNEALAAHVHHQETPMDAVDIESWLYERIRIMNARAALNQHNGEKDD